MKLGLDLAPIVQRIADEVPTLHLVGGAAEYAQAIIDGGATAPCVFVLASEDRAESNPFGSQAVQHSITAEFAIVIGVSALRDHRGGEGVDELQAVRSAIASALLNWQPVNADGEAADGFEYVRGRLTDFVESVVWWTETYSTGYVIRSE